MNLKQLKEEIPYKWRVQSTNKSFAACVAYIDARDVMNLLDKVVGAENWTSEFIEVGSGIFCTLSIYVGNKWVSKTDCGTESNVEAKKGQASDAFKRAAVQWGIGRFLYDLPIAKIWNVKAIGSKFKPVDEKGNNIYDVTKYFKQGNKVTVFNAIDEMTNCKSRQELVAVAKSYPSFKLDETFIAVGKAVKEKLTK